MMVSCRNVLITGIHGFHRKTLFICYTIKAESREHRLVLKSQVCTLLAALIVRNICRGFLITFLTPNQVLSAINGSKTCY